MKTSFKVTASFAGSKKNISAILLQNKLKIYISVPRKIGVDTRVGLKVFNWAMAHPSQGSTLEEHQNGFQDQWNDRSSVPLTDICLFDK